MQEKNHLLPILKFLTILFVRFSIRILTTLISALGACQVNGFLVLDELDGCYGWIFVFQNERS